MHLHIPSALSVYKKQRTAAICVKYIGLIEAVRSLFFENIPLYFENSSCRRFRLSASPPAPAMPAGSLGR